MATSPIAQPGVTVLQQISSAAVATATAVLPAAIVGPAFELVDVLDSSGVLNSNAYADEYEQYPLTIDQTSYPDPRSNLDELDIVESTVRAYLLDNGILNALPRGDGNPFGSAFLAASNAASRAVLISENDDAGGLGAWIVGGDTLIFALDQTVAADTSGDITVTFPGAGALSAAAVVAAINTAAGATIADVWVDPIGATNHVRLTSATWGAASSITIRAGSTGVDGLFADLLYRRVEGSGYRGQDDADGDLTTPWVEYFRGEATLTATANLWGPQNGGPAGSGMQQLDADGTTYTLAYSTAITFTGGSAIPLQASTAIAAGDEMYADGVLVGSAEVVEVQASRFRLAALDSALSTYNTDGIATSRVYNDVEVNNTLHGTPFAPRYVWFQARGLQQGSVSPPGVAAVLTGSNTGQAAQAAEVQSSFLTSTFTLALTGLTLIITYVKDGVTQPQLVLTFGSAPTNAGTLQTEIIAQLTAAGVAADFSVVCTSIVSPARTFVHISTTSTGDDQTLTVLSTGTANTLLGFSTVANTTHTGKDVEFATQATETGLLITAPMTNLDAAGYLLNMTVTDSRGVHNQVCLAAGIAAIAADTTIDAIATELNDQANQLAWDGNIRVGTFSGPATASGQLTFTTVEAGAGVSFAMTNPFATSSWTLLGFFDGAPFELEPPGATAYPTAAPDRHSIDITDVVAGPTTLTSAIYGALATSELIVQALNADAAATIAGGSTRLTYYVTSGGKVGTRSLDEGASITLLDHDAGAAVGFAALGFVGGEVGAAGTGANDDDTGSSDLAGNLFRWILNDGTCNFETTFATDSLEDAVTAINLLHGGEAVASISAAALRLTSPLLGLASRVEVDDTTADSVTTATVLGFLTANDIAVGSGRPDPDFYLDITGAARLQAAIIRNSLTGQPFCPIAQSVYLAYEALRLDVSPLSTAVEKLLTLDDLTAASTALSPVDTTRNPLGLGVYLALTNSPTTPVHALGVDAISAAQPQGTVAAYGRALDYLESKDVYALAPLTHEELVHQAFATHVTAMSAADQRGERIVFISPETPDRAYPTLVASGDADSTAASNQLVLDVNPSGALVTAGLNPAALLVADNVYIEITISGSFRRYNVSTVNGTLAVLNTTFAVTENTDGFFTTTTLTETVIDGDYALKIRGDELLIAGSTLPDNANIAQAVADASEGYANRRVFAIFPDLLEATLSSGSTQIPSYYAAAAIAGMVGQYEPQQPFTNVPISGFTSVVGSNDTFKPSQLDLMAGGGNYILQQAGQGAPITCRHQLSTDVSLVVRRELSITKAIDYMAKVLRNSLRNFIGRFNITPTFLNQLSTIIQGVLAFLGPEGLGVVANATLNNVIQDENQPDQILVDITAEPLYPSNYIRITIVV